MSGYFKIWRDLFDKAIWTTSTPEQKTILFTLLSMANYKEKEWIFEGKKFYCQPGQFITSLPSIAKKSGKHISEQNVRTALKLFKELGFLTDKSTAKGRLITIVNWELYQGCEYENQQTNQQIANRHLTDCQQTPNRLLTGREEGKEGKEGEECIKPLNIYKGENSESSLPEEPAKIIPEELPTPKDPSVKTRKKAKPDMTDIPYKEIIEYLNQKIGARYRSETEYYQAFIYARWQENFRLDDFKKVIDIKTDEWLGTNQAIYLRPETLFGKKFQSYLNQLGTGRITCSNFEKSNEAKEYSWTPSQQN